MRGSDRLRFLRLVKFGLIAVLVVVLVLIYANRAFGQRLPTGFHEHGQDYLKEFQRWYGHEHWMVPMATVEQESAWRRCPTSSVGARGLAQFMPRTEAAIERKYGISGHACDPEHAARLQALLMRENARVAGPKFRGFVPTWFAVLRSYNGSPGAFYCEWRAAGRPANTVSMEPFCGACGRPGWACKENLEYGYRIFDRWPKYLWYFY